MVESNLGPSKAAKFSHKRWCVENDTLLLLLVNVCIMLFMKLRIGCALTWSGPSGLRAGDKYYITLPLYHGNAGAVATAPCIFLGNTIVLREKFSASNFFSDIRKHGCIATVYVCYVVKSKSVLLYLDV